MKIIKNFLLLLIIVGIVIVLVTTNPSKNEFIDWLSNQLNEKADSGIEKFVNKTIGKPIISLSTTRSDYTVFSLYHVKDIFETDVIYLGIFKQFIRIK